MTFLGLFSSSPIDCIRLAVFGTLAFASLICLLRHSNAQTPGSLQISPSSFNQCNFLLRVGMLALTFGHCPSTPKSDDLGKAKNLALNACIPHFYFILCLSLVWYLHPLPLRTVAYLYTAVGHSSSLPSIRASFHSSSIHPCLPILSDCLRHVATG